MDLENLIFDFKRQIKAGLEITKIKIKNKFSNIVFCGMGGSNLVGDLLKTIFEIKIPILINKDYEIPQWVDKKTLIISISYSGNTEETLSSYKKAIEKKLPIISISSNGKLKLSSLKNKTPFIEIPFKNIQPRFSIWFQLAALIKLFYDLNLIVKPKYQYKDFLKSADRVLKKQIKLLAKKLSKKLKNKSLLIYSSSKNYPLLKIWKANFNENSKIPIFCNTFPEINHNEIAFLQNKNIPLNNFYALIILVGNEKKKILKRIKLTTKLFNKNNLRAEIINLKKKNFLTSLFSNIILGELTSVYLAKEYKINPLQIEIIEKFKKMMKK